MCSSSFSHKKIKWTTRHMETQNNFPPWGKKGSAVADFLLSEGNEFPFGKKYFNILKVWGHLSVNYIDCVLQRSVLKEPLLWFFVHYFFVCLFWFGNLQFMICFHTHWHTDKLSICAELNKINLVIPQSSLEQWETSVL